MQLLLRKQIVFNETSDVRNILDVEPSKLLCSAVTMILLVALEFLLIFFSFGAPLIVVMILKCRFSS